MSATLPRMCVSMRYLVEGVMRLRRSSTSITYASLHSTYATLAPVWWMAEGTAVKEKPDSVEFDDVISGIDAGYDATEVEFEVNGLKSPPGSNVGSAKLLSFGVLAGLSKEETIGKSLVANFITEEFKDSVREVLDAALTGKETANFEFPLFTKVGERKVILLNATTRRGPDGEVTGVIGVGQDITQIREITSNQERIADDLSRLIQSANAPILGVDMEGNINEWNRKAADMLG